MEINVTQPKFNLKMYSAQGITWVAFPKQQKIEHPGDEDGRGIPSDRETLFPVQESILVVSTVSEQHWKNLINI